MESIDTDLGADKTIDAPKTENFKTCEHCGQIFSPRLRSGGKPQRFCTQDCREAFHAKANVSQRSPTCGALAVMPATVDRPEPENAPAGTTEEFDWNDPDSMVLLEQRETAIYWNPRGEIVIRQRSYFDDDSVIYVAPKNIADFIDKLTDIAGIPSAGR